MVDYKRIAPADLTQSCDELPPLQQGANMGDLAGLTINIASLYNDCRQRHQKLAEWIKDAG